MMRRRNGAGRPAPFSWPQNTVHRLLEPSTSRHAGRTSSGCAIDRRMIRRPESAAAIVCGNSPNKCCRHNNVTRSQTGHVRRETSVVAPNGQVSSSNFRFARRAVLGGNLCAACTVTASNLTMHRRSVAAFGKTFDAPGRDAAPACFLARFDERDGLFGRGRDAFHTGCRGERRRNPDADWYREMVR